MQSTCFLHSNGQTSKEQSKNGGDNQINTRYRTWKNICANICARFWSKQSKGDESWLNRCGVAQARQLFPCSSVFTGRSSIRVSEIPETGNTIASCCWRERLALVDLKHWSWLGRWEKKGALSIWRKVGIWGWPWTRHLHKRWLELAHLTKLQVL